MRSPEATPVRAWAPDQTDAAAIRSPIGAGHRPYSSPVPRLDLTPGGLGPDGVGKHLQRVSGTSPLARKKAGARQKETGEDFKEEPAAMPHTPAELAGRFAAYDPVPPFNTVAPPTPRAAAAASTTTNNNTAATATAITNNDNIDHSATSPADHNHHPLSSQPFLSPVSPGLAKGSACNMMPSTSSTPGTHSQPSRLDLNDINGIL